MIRNIEIQGYKSFHPTSPVNIPLETEIQKPVFFYGLNGAGKTAIGEVIQGWDIGDPKFQTCRVHPTPGGPFRYLVYNHHFVHSVIGEAEGMPGIFTIGKLDTDTQKRIDEYEGLLKHVRDERENIEEDLKRIKGQLIAAFNDAKDQIWEIYKKYDKGTFDNFLTGYGRNKKKFFEDLRKYETLDSDNLEKLDSLAKRLADISGGEVPKNVHRLPLDVFAIIEQNGIWQERVKVSGESRLAPMLEKLGHGDWVSRGRDYVDDMECPFCQQGLPHDFLDELAKLFDETRQEKIDLINSNIAEYETAIQELTTAVENTLAEPFSQEAGIREAWQRVDAVLTANLATMRLKQATPSEPVEITQTDGRPLRGSLSALNDRIETFNQRINNKRAENRSIRELLWKNMCRGGISAYRAYDARIAPLKEELATAQQRDHEARNNQAEYLLALNELRKQQEGVDASVAAINERLQGLGIGSFYIARKPGAGSLYRLERPDDGESSTEGLSEGEKTLISFLYFMELLRGSKEQGTVVDIAQTVVVIDDPISSLSHNFVYDIASMIRHELIKPPAGPKARQVLVLTHNLFFLHELIYQIAGKNLARTENKCQLMRVVKGQHSRVEPMDARDVANDYDALWQIIQDAEQGIVQPQVIPNTMRCILENFFAFIGKTDELREILEKLSAADGKFRPLERFLNRGSHRDARNAAHIDWGQFDIAYYLTKLEGVFREAGYPDHYRLKMGRLEVAK